MGYTGGKTEHPTYETVCGGDGHTEALKIEFDPTVVSYEELLKTFVHNASSLFATPYSIQYMNAIWYTDDKQKEAIESFFAKTFPHKKVTLPIRRLDVWYDAEDYHQKYYNKSSRW